MTAQKRNHRIPDGCRTIYKLVQFAIIFWAISLSPIGAQAQEIPPIYITGMVHIDPFAVDAPDTMIAINSYNLLRNSFLWYVAYAESTGLRLSAQMTGVYAEACIRRGNASDFASFMPGGHHQLGTHTHANVKKPRNYLWHQLADQFFANPDSARRVMFDNIPWINQIFTANGFSSVDNWFYHGSHMSYPGMDTVLFSYPEPDFYPYDNNYRMCAATRGWHSLYNGGFLTEPSESSDTNYIKFPEVGGIIGYDELHGPEGMVYGTIPYQRRDFLRVYIEWRESARRHQPRALRYFCWMIHPFQLLPNQVGTDGRPARQHIRELVEWLNNNYIGHADETGSIIAQYGNAGEIRQAYETWKTAYPEYYQELQASLSNGEYPLYFPAIFSRMETTYHQERMVSADSLIAIEKLIDRQTAQPVYLTWSKSGTRPIEPTLNGWFVRLRGDGACDTIYSSYLAIDEEPVILEPTSGPSCEYVLGDINGNGSANGLDITYGVNYFKGSSAPPISCDCPPNGVIYAASDVNGSCTFNGLDVTYMVNYFKGGAALITCPDCPASRTNLLSKFK